MIERRWCIALHAKLSDLPRPIPGIEGDHVGNRPRIPAARTATAVADVVIVGGGFTGLSAAAHLAKTGADVVLIEAHRFGDGASGRNGGQLGTGQRAWAEELEEELGLAARQGAVRAGRRGQGTSRSISPPSNGIDIDLHARAALGGAQAALLSTTTRRMPSYMASRFGYPHIAFMDAAETADAARLDTLFRRHRATPAPATSTR